MTVRAKDVTAGGRRAKQIVTAAGGYLARESRTVRHATAAQPGLQDPADALPRAARPPRQGAGQARVAEPEDRGRHRARSPTWTSRLKSAKAALDSLRTLLERANTIGEVLGVEREISDRESELESLQAQAEDRWPPRPPRPPLTLRLIGPVTAVTEEPDEPAGFLGGLQTAGRPSSPHGRLTLWACCSAWLAVLAVPRLTAVRSAPLPARAGTRARPADRRPATGATWG